MSKYTKALIIPLAISRTIRANMKYFFLACPLNLFAITSSVFAFSIWVFVTNN